MAKQPSKPPAPSAPTQPYTVKSRLMHDGKVYQAGETVELTAEEAKRIPHAVVGAPDQAEG